MLPRRRAQTRNLEAVTEVHIGGLPTALICAGDSLSEAIGVFEEHPVHGDVAVSYSDRSRVEVHYLRGHSMLPTEREQAVAQMAMVNALGVGDPDMCQVVPHKVS